MAKEQPQTDIQMRRTKGKMSSGEVCFLPHPDLPRRGRRKRLLPDGEKKRGANLRGMEHQHKTMIDNFNIRCFYEI